MLSFDFTPTFPHHSWTYLEGFWLKFGNCANWIEELFQFVLEYQFTIIEWINSRFPRKYLILWSLRHRLGSFNSSLDSTLLFYFSYNSVHFSVINKPLDTSLSIRLLFILMYSFDYLLFTGFETKVWYVLLKSTAWRKSCV